MAKGTVYLYFRTKEEIFAALLLQGWGAVLEGIAGCFQAAGGRRDGKVARFLAAYRDHLRTHPELLRLDALGYGVLEQNLEPATLRAFKVTFLARLTATGAVIDDTLRLEAGRGVTLLLRTYALTRGLWQSSRPGEPAALSADPALVTLRPDFDHDLAAALQEYWRGALMPA